MNAHASDGVVVHFPHTVSSSDSLDSTAELVHLLEEASMLEVALDEIERGTRRLRRARAAKAALYGLLPPEPSTNAELRADWLAHHPLEDAKHHLGCPRTGSDLR